MVKSSNIILRYLYLIFSLLIFCLPKIESVSQKDINELQKTVDDTFAETKKKLNEFLVKLQKIAEQQPEAPQAQAQGDRPKSAPNQFGGGRAGLKPSEFPQP